MLATHLKIALFFALAFTALYQWLRADSAIGYSEGLLAKLKIAQHDIRRLEQNVITLQIQIDELRGLP